jgi:hypothetical protein
MNSRSVIAVPTQHECPTQIWDSGDYSPKDAFPSLREEVCAHGMVWLPSIRSKGDALQARFEVKNVEKGNVSRVRCPYLNLERTHTEIAKSSLGGFFGGLVLSGSLTIIHNDAPRVLKSGDLLAYDLSYPVKVCSGVNLEATGFFLPTGSSSVIDKNKHFFAQIESFIGAQKEMGPIVAKAERFK